MTHVKTLDDAVCISHSASTPGKRMNQTILPPFMVKKLGRLRS